MSARDQTTGDLGRAVAVWVDDGGRAQATAPVDPAIVALLAAQGDEADLTLAEQRAAYVETAIALGGDPIPVASVQDMRVPRPDGGEVAVRVHRPIDAPDADTAVLVWCHGGGWVLGDLDGFDRVARRLATAGRCVCVSVDYRLAPEHPFPAAIEDALAVVRWAAGPGAASLGTAPGKVRLGGDSSGGQIAAAGALGARELVAEQLLVYPALDPALASESYAEFADGPMLTRAAMRTFWNHYRAERPIDDPELDVLAGDLTGAPPARIAVAAHDPLRDDGLRYAELLGAAGVGGQTRVFDTMTHGFLRWGAVVSQAQDLIDWLA